MKKHYLSLLFIALSTVTLIAQVPSYVPTNGLVGWWPFSGNANDMSGNGNNGTVNGATLTTDRFGSASSAYAFNGVNCCGVGDPVQEIVVANQILNLGQNYSISCWMSSSSIGKFQQCLFNSINHPGFAVEFNSEHVVGKITYALGTGNSWDLLYAPGTSTSFQNNTWYHIVFVKNGTTYTLYLNGVIDGTTTVGASANYTQNAAIRFGSIGGGHEVFKGALDDYGIWNRALTSTEISGLQNATAFTTPTPAPILAVSPAATTICAGSSATLSATANAGSTVCSSSQLPTGLQSGLVGYWPFCGNANDASGNGNNGTVNGATLTTDRFGNASSAYSFDGVNDHVVVQDTPILKPSNSISLCAWVNINMSEQSDFNAIIYKSHNQSQNYSSYSLITGNAGFNQTGNPGFTIRTTSSYNWTGANGTSTQAPGQNILNQWQFVCGTWDGTNMKIYQNGILIATVPQGGTIIYNTENLFFGKRKDGNGLDDYFTGLIDDIGIWNRTLTATEIQQLYTLGNATYSWSPGGATTPSITVSPTATTTYTCTATANGVSSSATSVVTVLPAPTITASNTTICAGQSTTLSVNGGQPSSSNCIGNLGSPNPWPFPTAANAGYIPLGTFGTQATFSVSMWINPSQTQNGVSIILDASHGGGANWVIQSINSGATWAWGTGEFTLTPNVWQHLLITYNNGSRKVFVNGSQVLSWSQLMSYSGSPSLTLGNWTEGGRRFNGLIDELYITTDIIHTTNFTPQSVVQTPSTATFGLWHFDEGTGTSTSNVSNTSYPLNNWYWATRSLSSGSSSTVSWSPGGATTPSITVSPTTTTTYTCTVTDASGTSCSATQTITVVPTPTITTTNTSICAGQSTTLTASTTSTGSGSNCPTLSGTLSTGLVGYWPFCGNANDASGNGNNGTVNGATLTTDRFGNTNSAYSFNGSSSIDIGVNGFSTGNNQASLSGWVYITTNPAGVSYIVGYGNPNVNGSVFATGVYGSAGLFGTFSGAVYDAISNINCPLNSWNLVTTVKEANGTIKIYLNGNLIFTQTVSTPLIGNVSGRIGRAVWNSSEYWNGKIDDVAIWNRALTAAEVLALYNNGQTSYSWSNGASTPSITVTPTTTTTYTCTVTDANGNSCSASQTITVVPFSNVNAGSDVTICAGGTATLTATGATNYTWNNAIQNGVAFSPVSSSSYIVTGTQNGCTDADTVLVTVVADPTITNPVAASYCQNGGTVTPLSVSVAGGISAAYSYQWYTNTTVNNFGGTPVLGATTPTYTPPINNVGTVFYYCTVTQGAVGTGCLATSGANSIVVNAQPTITSQPVSSQSGCVGANITPLTLALNGGGGTPNYQWFVNTVANTTNGTAIAGATNASYSPGNSATGTNYFYCVATYPNAASCATQTSNVATISLINDPIFTIPPTASQSICVGGSIPALTFNSSGGSGTASYQWYAVSGSTYTTILGATNPSYTPPVFNLTGTYAYSVAITQTAAGCASGFSPLANITVVADPNVSSPGAANYCQGGAVSNPLTVTATGGINSGYAYQWFSNGSNNNTSGVAISGATGATYAPPTTAVGNLFYYCVVSQGSGCATSSAPAAISVVPGPALVSQPLATQSVCVGSTLNAFTVAYTGGAGTPSYQWFSSTTNTNSNGTPISGATNASYTPGANAVGQVYYYCVISFNALTSCSSISSTPGQVNVIANPVFSVAPLSSQTICQGANPQVLSFTTSGGSGTATYQWYNVVNNNYTPIIGANGLTYTPSNSLPTGTYNYAVAMTQNASGCSTGFSPNAQLVVLPQPVVSTPIGGVFCQGGTISQPLNVSVTGGNGSSSYQWYQSTINTNTGGTPITGATSSSYTPSLVNFGTLYYYCTVTQNAGCAANSAVATVVSNPSPVISAQPLANQTICVGSAPSPLSTSYTGGVGTPSYQWFVNNQNTTLGGTPIAGANSSAYVPSNQVGLGTNYYFCVVTLSNSSCPQATTNVAAVNTVSNPSVNGPQSSTYCQSTAVAQPLSVSASGGNGTSYSYQWYSNVNNTNFGGNPILGANNPNYTPNINGTSNNFYCVVTQPGGCQAASAVATITIVSTPNIASQPIAGQTLCIGGLAQALSISITGGVSNPSFQWYSNTANTMTNATLIANASTPTYTPSAAISTGTIFYFCQVNFTTNSACPALVSNAATIIAVSDPAASNPANANYCQNATSVAPLSVTASGGINTSYLYQWYSNTNNSNVGGSPIAGANTSTYVPLVNQIGTIYYYCEVTQGSGCAVLSGVSAIVVGVAANINLQPTSSQNLCLGQATSPLTVGVSAGNYALNYQWYSNVNNNNFGGSVIVGATNAFYTPPSNALGTKYYYCVITIAGGGCGNLTSNTAGITVLSAPTMFQPNSQTVCCQSSTTPINFVGNASSYSWTANSSSPQLTGFSTSGGGNIPSLLLTNNSATPQNIVYLVTPSNQGCAGTPVQFNISVMPCLSVNVPSDQYYCPGETVSSNVFTGVGQTYSWVNTNTTIGLQNAGINFVPNFVAQNTTATTQIATIIVTPSFMGCAGTAQSYSISVYPLPTVDAGVDQEICSGGSVTLTANGAPNLVWDNGILNGQTFVPNATTTYTVTGTDANGCQNQDAVFVQVNQPTSATLNINACNSYTLNGQTYTQSGTYDQLLSNSAGCDSSLTLNLSLNFSPTQPNIYVQNQINLSTDLTPGLTYQWITCTDLTSIAGQTAITYNPTSNGVYAVVVTNGCGSDTSLCTSITTIGLEELLSAHILLYPNPNKGAFTLELPQALIGQTIQIFDMAGRLIQETTAQEIKQHIELKDVATGSYWLRIGGEIPMKLVKN